MAINIGSQHAGVINNAEGNQTVHIGNATYNALVDRVREEVRNVPLPPAVRAEVDAELDAVGGDPSQAVGRVGRVVGLLRSAGALAGAGGGLASALSALIGSFGALGEPLAAMLP
ncbi:hypothetical protein [Saccharothrix variisporea]|uniref:Uncharacterized protein n=1 Tax=Saccharothrix variisporea TaxID=543527 RepID=A0A495XMD1_9PSEU|nr:hypothetical protein [Saccharothrix variisporea]RKT72768.1 hypothetical protein DFJ66_6092 [Saccharothrix variisporea]